jgi:hypothetical protein
MGRDGSPDHAPAVVESTDARETSRGQWRRPGTHRSRREVVTDVVWWVLLVILVIGAAAAIYITIKA